VPLGVQLRLDDSIKGSKQRVLDSEILYFNVCIAALQLSQRCIHTLDDRCLYLVHAVAQRLMQSKDIGLLLCQICVHAFVKARVEEDMPYMQLGKDCLQRRHASSEGLGLV
jgi:hypothetical protein